MHRMLERQIAHNLGEHAVIPEEIKKLLEAISESYAHFDEDRLQLDRSLELSSKEFFENSKQLKEAKENTEKTVLLRTNQLHKEHAKLIAAVNSLSVGLLIIDTNYHLLTSNDSLTTILGIQSAPGGITFEDVEHVLGEGCDLRGYCSTAFSQIQKLEIKDIHVQEKYLRIALAPVVLPSDATVVIGGVILIEDITEAKLFEQGRDDFFSIASHELRTPLTAIRGNASMLLEYYADKMTDADMRQMIDDMLVSSERLIHIVNDFLDVSRLEQKRLVFHNEAFDICPIAEKTKDELKDLALAKNIQLRFMATDGPCPLVVADPARVKQVLMNLIGNAINYTSQGEIVITPNQSGNFLKVLIKDTGVGIKEDQHDLLFRKFQQAGGTDSARNKTSTGLGLYISKLMAEGMGGVVALEESELGKGSTFSFSLPIASAEHASNTVTS